MKNLFKFLGVAVGLVLIALAIGGIFLSLQAQDALRTALEKTLSYSLGAEVSIDSLRIAPFQHKLELQGLNVSNPDGFPTGTALGFEKVIAVFDIKSLTSGTPTITLLDLHGIQMNIRHELGEGTNILKLINTLPSTPDTSGQRKFLVQELRCSEAHTTVSTNLLPKVQPDFSITPFTLKNVGEGRAIGAGEVGVIVIKSLLQNGVRSALKPIRDILEGSPEPQTTDRMEPIREQP